MSKQFYSKKYTSNKEYKFDHKDVVRVLPKPGQLIT